MPTEHQRIVIHTPRQMIQHRLEAYCPQCKRWAHISLAARVMRGMGDVRGRYATATE